MHAYFYNNQLTGSLPTAVEAILPAVTFWSGNCVVNCTSPLSYCSNVERWALVDLYLATNGPAWVNNSNWMIGATPCAWFGVTCQTANGPVT